MASRPINILHVTYDMRIGGTEQVIRNLIESSSSNDTPMSIFCIETPLGPWGEQLRAAGVRIVGRNRSPGLDLRLVMDLRSHIKRHGIDVVHCHQYTPWVYGALAAFGLKTRVIFTEHGRFYPDSSSPKRRIVNPLLARLTHRITAISRSTRQALADFEYLPIDRIDVIYNGILGLTSDPAGAKGLKDRLQIPDDAPIVGTVARFDPIKNHRMMLIAFQQVLELHPECRLLLVGDGEERESIESLINELGIGGRVLLPGYIPDPSCWLNAMDVFLLSSFSEGTSMTLLEAMSLGKPCVVTKVGGNPEIIEDGENGWVTPSDNAEAFAAAVHEMLSDNTQLNDMGLAGSRRFAECFTSSAMAATYAGLYAEAG